VCNVYIICRAHACLYKRGSFSAAANRLRHILYYSVYHRYIGTRARVCVCVCVYTYHNIMYIILSATKSDDDYTTVPAVRREWERDRETETEGCPILCPLVLCEICSSAKIIFRPNGRRRGVTTAPEYNTRTQAHAYTHRIMYIYI